MTARGLYVMVDECPFCHQDIPILMTNGTQVFAYCAECDTVFTNPSAVVQSEPGATRSGEQIGPFKSWRYATAGDVRGTAWEGHARQYPFA